MIWIVIGLYVVDGWTTYQLRKRGGRELNPVLAALIARIGPYAALMIAKGAAVAALLWAAADMSPGWWALIAAGYAGVVSRNLYLLYGRRL